MTIHIITAAIAATVALTSCDAQEPKAQQQTPPAKPDLAESSPSIPPAEQAIVNELELLQTLSTNGRTVGTALAAQLRPRGVPPATLLTNSFAAWEFTSDFEYAAAVLVGRAADIGILKLAIQGEGGILPHDDFSARTYVSMQLIAAKLQQYSQLEDMLRVPARKYAADTDPAINDAAKYAKTLGEHASRALNVIWSQADR